MNTNLIKKVGNIFLLYSLLLMGYACCLERGSEQVRFSAIFISPVDTLVSQEQPFRFQINGYYTSIAHTGWTELNLIPSARAFQECESTPLLNETIKEIKLYSTEDFSPDFPKGTLLNELVEIDSLTQEGNIMATLTLPQFIDFFNAQPPSASKTELLPLTVFKIKVRPSLSQTHVFRLELTTEDGNQFQAISPRIQWL